MIDASHDLTTALAWRGKVMDATGYYYLGTRYYDPQSGSFLSCDPLGHDASMDLYSYCNGDPVNRFDADGRCPLPSGSSSGASQAPNAPNALTTLTNQIQQDQDNLIRQQYEDNRPMNAAERQEAIDFAVGVAAEIVPMLLVPEAEGAEALGAAVEVESAMNRMFYGFLVVV